MPQGPRVVYLAGFGRSGSTLLERLLGALPGWTHVGELVDLARSVTVKQERCGCGEPFTECPVWSAVGERAFGGWDVPEVRRLAELRLLVARQRQLPRLLRHHAAATAPARTGPRAEARAGLRTRATGGSDAGFSALVAEYQEGYGRIYRAVAEVTGSEVVVDASKGPAHGVALAGGSSYDLSMLNLVRDPRAVAYSWSRRSIARPQAGAEPDDMWRISPLRSAAQWSGLQAELELVRSRGRFATARLRYEDLVEQPAATISSALSAIGIDVPPHAMAHIDGTSARLGTSHGLSGNPGRFDTGVIELRPDTRWRTGLPAADQRLVTAVCLPLLLAYGYPMRPQGPAASPMRTKLWSKS
jgi:hypothetical protein